MKKQRSKNVLSNQDDDLDLDMIDFDLSDPVAKKRTRILIEEDRLIKNLIEANRFIKVLSDQKKQFGFKLPSDPASLLTWDRFLKDDYLLKKLYQNYMKIF